MEEHLSDLGTADFALYKSMQDWHSHINDKLADVNDVLNPHGFDEIVKDDFAKLRQILSERLMLITRRHSSRTPVTQRN
jgi:hypothetical protein